jgi:hypothetical protein
MFLESSPDCQRSQAQGKSFKQFVTAIILTASAGLSISCAGISPTTQAPNPSKNFEISLAPSTAVLSSGGQQQFSATLTSTSNTAVTWKASAGLISPTGLYTAPVVTTATKTTVIASSVEDGSRVAISQITVNPQFKLMIDVSSLPKSTVGARYNASLAATGGTAPYAWQIISGGLPRGLWLDKDSGVITGKPEKSGTFNFTTSVTDANSRTATLSLSLQSDPAITEEGKFDGPAELPRVYVQSDLAYTPAPGSVISVPKGGDFQQALDKAQCGETIELQAGAVYTGSFTVPAHPCDDAHWIIVRTSAPDSSLPPEGTRISPCYAGVSSLPARPAFNCTSTNNVLAKVQFPGNGSGPITFADGANHYRFIGLEITRTPGSQIVYNLAFNHGSTADHIIFDRSWLHGTPQDETQRGVMLSGSRYAAVVDSYFSDFHCVSRTGACVDAQAIAGGLGDNPSGPYKIVNNFLEAAAECILVGGGKATMTPSDIEIRRNHMFKPMIWMQGQPGYVGGVDGNPFIVKNLFELKNARRVLFEANILENTWGGFSQAGFAMLLSPKNQAIGTGNVCPLCQVTDITIRYITISHIGGVMQIANGISSNGGVPLDGQRYSIHDVTADDVDPVKYAGYGVFAQISMGKHAPVLQHVTISHVTAFQPGPMLNLGDDIAVNPAMNDFVFTNNIINAGSAPTKTTGGGPSNCGYAGAPLESLGRCFRPYTFSHNAVIGTPATQPASRYPAGNYFPATAPRVDFVNYNSGNGGDYQLQASSPYRNAGTDGKDLGADINAIQAATAGVR